MIWLFWASVALLAYNYLGYPLLCMLRARLSARPFSTLSCEPPRVSVLVAVHNECDVIQERIHNIANQTQLPLELLIGSDGSSDRTAELARETASHISESATTVRVFEFERGGKLATLGRLAAEARGDVLVFTDANSSFAATALEEIVRPLTHPAVGCVAGAKVVNGGHQQTEDGERSYWGMENRLKQWESAFGSCAGADGALYAIRRADFPHNLPSGLLADDLYLSLATISPERRCVLAPAAQVHEASDTTAANELRRKARIFAGAFSALILHRRLLLPWSGASFVLWSHKVLRWFGFVLFAASLAGSIALPSPEREIFWLAAVLMLAFALVGYAFPAALRTRIVRLAFYFGLMNLGQILGVVEWARSRHKPTWEKVR